MQSDTDHQDEIWNCLISVTAMELTLTTVDLRYKVNSTCTALVMKTKSFLMFNGERK